MKWSKVKNALTSVSLMFLIISLGYVSIFIFEHEIDQNYVEAASTWTQTSDKDFNDGTFNNRRARSSGTWPMNGPKKHLVV